MSREAPVHDSTSNADVAQQRSHTYQFLASMFAHEPTRQLLEQFSQPAIVEPLTDIGIVYGDALWERPVDERVAELAVEYTRLFLGPGPHIALQESVQRGEGQLWGDATSQAVQHYAEAGFAVEESYTDLPDHLSVELQFLSFVSAREAQQWTAGAVDAAHALVRQERQFLEAHLLQWAPHVARQVNERAQWAFYRACASLMNHFIINDNKYLRNI